jgi:hypothetical protein
LYKKRVEFVCRFGHKGIKAVVRVVSRWYLGPEEACLAIAGVRMSCVETIKSLGRLKEERRNQSMRFIVLVLTVVVLCVGNSGCRTSSYMSPYVIVRVSADSTITIDGRRVERGALVQSLPKLFIVIRVEKGVSPNLVDTIFDEFNAAGHLMCIE